jgi:hypothetical protein
MKCGKPFGMVVRRGDMGIWVDLLKSNNSAAGK